MAPVTHAVTLGGIREGVMDIAERSKTSDGQEEKWDADY
jgi:hypothetical protein